MAEDQELNAADSGSEDLQGTMPSVAVEAPKPGDAGSVPAPSSWSGLFLVMALLAVGLTLVGVYGQYQKVPQYFGSMGSGLILWGLLDLIAQRRGLVVWRGPKAIVGNSINLVRGLSLLGIGLWLLMMGLGTVKPASTALLVNIVVIFVGAYLGIALFLELLVKGLKVSAQAFLLGALVLQVLSFIYFTIPFTYSWAAIFAGLSFASGAWAIFGGATEENPALSRAVLIATVLVGAPLATYTFQQMFVVHEQPLFTPTLLIPRMRQVAGDLGEDAAQILWAPRHTNLGQPGDVTLSDKMAFTDYRDDEPVVGLFVQREDKPEGELTWVKTGESAQLTAFSEDGRLLAYTDVKEEGAQPHLAVLGPSGAMLSPWPDEPKTEEAAVSGTAKKEDPKAKHKRKKAEAKEASLALSSYSVKRPYPSSVAPGPEHGQVWRGLGKQIYFASPEGAPKKGGSAVLSADMAGQKYVRLREGRGLPAISPDGSELLTVGFAPNVRYLEMADGANGERDQRVFGGTSEKRYFPAWNAAQTRVIFLKNGKLHTMKSNGTDQQDFNPEALDSRLWFSDKTVPFTLQWKESGDRWLIYKSDPQGRHESLVYEAKGKSISAPQWSANGKRIGFILHGEESSMVMTVGPHGEWPRRFFTTKDGLRELKWSPDSLKLAWLVDRGEDAQEAWTAVEEGMSPEKVYESSGTLNTLSWSPAGKHLAMEETKAWRFLGLAIVKPQLHNVLMVDLVEKQARVMTRYGLMSRQPSFSPQGIAIAYFTDDKPWAFSPKRDRRNALVISQLY